ncbi:MAG: hypothetical protein K8R88_09865 [Armatimonadetes bacterium]|nr:hypothetical protein [Armatimonadota bacterium]
MRVADNLRRVDVGEFVGRLGETPRVDQRPIRPVTEKNVFCEGQAQSLASG